MAIVKTFWCRQESAPSPFSKLHSGEIDSHQANDDEIIIPRYGDFGESPAGQPKGDRHGSQNSQDDSRGQYLGCPVVLDIGHLIGELFGARVARHYERYVGILGKCSGQQREMTLISGDQKEETRTRLQGPFDTMLHSKLDYVPWGSGSGVQPGGFMLGPWWTLTSTVCLDGAV